MNIFADETKKKQKWLILFQTIVLLAVLALMNAQLRQSQKVTSTKLIQTFVPIVVLVLMFVRLKQFILNKTQTSY